MGPLQNLEQWDEFVGQRYKPDKKQEEFRQYNDSTPPGVREFYRLNHTHQTYEFAQAKRAEYLGRNRRQMGLWEAAEFVRQKKQQYLTRQRGPMGI